MNCCVECFHDEEIRTMIEKANKGTGDCDFCGQKNVLIYPVNESTELSDLISDVINVYEEADDGKPLFSVMIQDWGIFKDLASTRDLIAAFCSIINEDDEDMCDKKVRLPQKDMEQYGVLSGHTWQEFSDEIKYTNRFISKLFKHDRFTQFLTFCIKTYDKGTKFYRARVCNNQTGYGTKDMFSPPIELRKPGRVNPEGMGVLYLTSDEETALHEVRASKFDLVTIGEFELKKKIRVVDISRFSNISPAIYTGGMGSLAVNRKIFADIAKEIAKPLRRNDSSLEYLPTQFITEFIRSQAYEGVAYNSAMGTGGINLAVFNENLFKCEKVYNVEIENINYQYDNK